tara:strand:- start:286 stop:711 length:426 start_codon:yes stop_codon:yes gene_type:complete
LYYCYGQIRSSLTTTPINNGLWVASTLLTAGDNPIEVRMGSYWGGDANEFWALALAPPGFVNGSIASDGDTNGIIPITQAIKGGIFTNVKKGTVFVPTSMDQSIIFPIIIPPYYNLIIYPVTSTSSAAANFQLFGQELVKP